MSQLTKDSNVPQIAIQTCRKLQNLLIADKPVLAEHRGKISEVYWILHQTTFVQPWDWSPQDEYTLYSYTDAMESIYEGLTNHVMPGEGDEDRKHS